MVALTNPYAQFMKCENWPLYIKVS